MASGTLFIVSAPSGAGKTSLVTALREKIATLAVSVSHTTRARREGELDGKNYFFVNKDEFEEKIEAGEFVEHAMVFDHYYGTSLLAVEAQLSEGVDVILEIDWQGARQVRNKMQGAQSIFILPPSRTELVRRLRGRGQDSEDIIARRMQDAEQEMSHYSEYDYLVINDDFQLALMQLEQILQVNRLAMPVQQLNHSSLIGELLAD